MNPIVFALRRPYTVMVLVVSMALGGLLALSRMSVDIFPNLNLPVVYVAQPYGGMDPAQMEGLITNYYEYHFLYIGGIHHVESRNIQGMALMKLYFHPETNMAQAMAETIGYVNRSRAFMPVGTVPPFVTRFDAGSIPVGYLVLSSETRPVGEIQDQALFKVRPMFAALPGVSAPPPFGGSQRTVLVRIDPEKLRSYSLPPQEVIDALNQGNAVSPSGSVRIGDSMPIVPLNAMVREPKELEDIPIRTARDATVYLRDVATVVDASDIATGYALLNGRRAVYILVTKRAEASTVSVVESVRKAIPNMQAVLPGDIKVSFEFDQSPTVIAARKSVFTEGLLGACLTGLMVLVFLRDLRTVLIVVLNIPLAILGALLALWLTGQTINLMTLGGLALAVGILVDEATVEIENIHHRLGEGTSVARAVRQGNLDTAVPRLLAMLCILAVFIPSFFMTGAARALFVPLALSVGFSMIASYLLSSTFVPVLSVWLLRPTRGGNGLIFGAIQAIYERLLRATLTIRWGLTPLYLGGTCFAIAILLVPLGREIFPNAAEGRFQLRIKGPTGTRIERTESIVLETLDVIKSAVGAENVNLSIAYAGTVPSTYPINAVYQWTGGPEEAMLRVALKHGAKTSVEELKETLRTRLEKRLPGVRYSFEPADIVNEVMSFGSPTPIEVQVNGPSLADNQAHAEKVMGELRKIGFLRDLQFGQNLDYPTIRVDIDRQRAGLGGVTASDVAKSVVAATSSSRFVVPNFWADPKTGIGYQVQVEVPYALMNSTTEVETIPIRQEASRAPLLLRDVAKVSTGTMPGQFDRYNMRRLVTISANLQNADLGRRGRAIQAAIRAAGTPPKGVQVDVRGQVETLGQMTDGLTYGLGVAIVVILLLLIGYFQSIRLAVVVIATTPAVLLGVLGALTLTRTTINIQSFNGAIMAVGVAVANSILLITFAERARLEGKSAVESATIGALGRLRPILMTSLAMIAGMLPIAAGLGETGEQVAPLGRAVIGGLIASTITTLLIVPALFAILNSRSSTRSTSLDPDDPESTHFDALVVVD